MNRRGFLRAGLAALALTTGLGRGRLELLEDREYVVDAVVQHHGVLAPLSAHRCYGVAESALLAGTTPHELFRLPADARVLHCSVTDMRELVGQYVDMPT